MNNNKGFFLAETIIMIALVTTVMAFVAPNVTKLYENYKLQEQSYDQIEDLYTLKAIYDANKNKIDEYTVDGEIGCKKYSGYDSKDIINNNNIEWPENSGKYSSGKTKLYLTGYMNRLKEEDDYDFNKYLRRLKITTNDGPSYRLIAKFTDAPSPAKITYASIRIDNPNPNRSCNLDTKGVIE